MTQGEGYRKGGFVHFRCLVPCASRTDVDFMMVTFQYLGTVSW